MTPPRLNELRCPGCQQISWFIDADYRGMDGVKLPFDKRWYTCPHCRRDHQGWTLGQQSPAEFLLQPSRSAPMSQADFDYWVGILRTHFPTHSALSRLGTTFFPFLPEEAEARAKALAGEHPVIEMRDQDGARCYEPDLRIAREWLDVMKPGDSLTFWHRDGGFLQLTLDDSSYSGSCVNATGMAVSQALNLNAESTRTAIERYLSGEWTDFPRNRIADAGFLSRIWNQLIDRFSETPK